MFVKWWPFYSDLNVLMPYAKRRFAQSILEPTDMTADLPSPHWWGLASQEPMVTQIESFEPFPITVRWFWLAIISCEAAMSKYLAMDVKHGGGFCSMLIEANKLAPGRCGNDIKHAI